MKNPDFWSKLKFWMFLSQFYGLKTRKICTLLSSDKIFVFGKNGPLIFDLRVKFLTEDMSWSTFKVQFVKIGVADWTLPGYNHFWQS